MIALIALVGPVGLACGDSEPGASAPGLTRSEFVDVVVALREAERTVQAEAPQDSADARFEERKDSILAAHGTTITELEEFLAFHADLAYQDALWDTITQRLKRPAFDPTAPGATPEGAAEAPERSGPEPPRR